MCYNANMAISIFFYLDRKKSHGMYLTEAFFQPIVQPNDLNIMVVLVWVLFELFYYNISSMCILLNANECETDLKYLSHPPCWVPAGHIYWPHSSTQSLGVWGTENGLLQLLFGSLPRRTERTPAQVCTAKTRSCPGPADHDCSDPMRRRLLLGKSAENFVFLNLNIPRSYLWMLTGILIATVICWSRG